MKHLKLCMCLIWVFSISLAIAQDLKPITGRVLNQNGEPIAGATVRGVKNIVTSTDIDGKFSIQIESNSSLSISFLGKSMSVPINGRSNLDITFNVGDQVMDELVVVGYGTQKKSNLTSSVSTIDEKAFESRAISNVMSAMQGAAPGLVVSRGGGQPGNEAFNVKIRGELSTGGSNPLVLIDGAPGTLTNLNFDDIASVTILKDASATAIYGSRGASGVILVTTKMGSGAPKVNYQGMFTAKKLGMFPKRINSWEEAEMQNLARINAGQAPDWSEELINLMKDPNFYYRINPNNPSQYQYLGNFNYPEILLNDFSRRLNHNLSISGNTENDSYLFSLGYLKDKGIFKFGPDDFNKLNARLNYAKNFDHKIKLDAKVSFVRSERNYSVIGASNDYGLIYNLVSSRSLSPIYLPESGDKLYAAGSGAGETVGLLKEGGGNKYVSQDISTVIEASKGDFLTPGLNLRLIYSPRFFIESDDNKTLPVPMYNVNGRTGWAGGLNQNSVSKARGLTISNNWQFITEYNKTFNKHEILARGGYRYDDFNYDIIGASASNLPTNDILALRQFLDKANTGISDNIQNNTLISFFGTAQYVYDSKYIIQATLNREGSSRLSPANRWITLPGVSAGWRINNESWFDSFKNIFNEFKLRAAWGKQANDPNSDNQRANNYGYISTLSKGDSYPFNDIRNTFYWEGSSVFELRKWEEVENTDVGLDFSLLNNKLSGAFSYFWRTTNGTYGTVTQPAVFGLSGPSMNVGKFKSWGWELELKWNDKIGESFNYFISANVADNDNKVISYLNRNTIGAGVNGIIEGYAKNSVFGYKTDGYFQNAEEIANNKVNHSNSNLGPGDIRYVDLNGDNVISVGLGNTTDMGDLVYLGSQNNRYNFGFNFGFDYKGFDFSAFVQGVGKRQYLLPNVLTLPYIESWRQAWDIHKDYWTPENPNAMFPRLVMGGGSNTRVSDKWVVNGAYARLKNVQLGYTLPEKLSQMALVKRARVFFSGEDLLEFKKSWNPYYDPETPNGQAFGYPFFRSFTFGLNVTF